jgi:hypothetical protein
VPSSQCASTARLLLALSCWKFLSSRSSATEKRRLTTAAALNRSYSSSNRDPNTFVLTSGTTLSISLSRTSTCYGRCTYTPIIHLYSSNCTDIDGHRTTII